jgi:Domain of unknown function (DUF1996)
MEASSQRTTGQVRLALMLILGVAAAVACVVTLMWWKAPVASAQDEGGDPTGRNFVVSCGFSHQKQVDPIADYGKNPSFHLHDFFGNTTTNENSTYDSLLAGGTTCDDPKDKAAYWIPTVSWITSRGKTTTLQASKTFFYYRAGLKDPVSVKPFPPGLKIITVQGKNVEWRCQGGTWSPTPPTRCGDNATLVLRIFFPDCLAVANDEQGQPILDQPLTDTADDPARFPDDPNAVPHNDHRSHMVAAGSEGCPTTHPYPVPRLQTNFLFKHNTLTTRGQVRLSTENNTGDYRTMHADFFNAWDQARLEDLVARCINAGPFTASNPKPIDCQ